MARKPDIRQVGDTYWFSLPMAARQAGLTKQELMRRAEAGQLITDPALPHEYWFDREEIWTLKLAKEARSEAWSKRNPNGAPERIKTKEQQEKQWAKISEEWGKGGRRDGPVSRHHVKVMLSGIHNKKRD